MKRLTLIVIVAALAWSAHWVWGSQRFEAQLAGWLDERRAEGWVAEAADISIAGFPNRYDATLDQLMLADPDRGLAWDMPFLQIFRLSYHPGHLIAVWPDTHRLATPRGGLALAHDDMRASLVVDRGAVARTVLVAEGLEIAGDGGGRLSATRAQLSAERLTIDAARYRMALQTEGVRPPDLPGLRAEAEGILPETFDQLRADMTVEFDRPWDAASLSDARPQPLRIDLALAEAQWGSLLFQAAGVLDVNGRGVPTGEIALKLRNWQDMIAMGRVTEAAPEALLGSLEQALTLLSGLSGRSDTLDMTLDFRGGRVFLGPVPLGPAPVIRLR